MQRILVTGGAGFIGSAVCRRLIEDGFEVLNVDKLTYAGNLASLEQVSKCPEYRFYHLDICDEPQIRELLISEQVDAIMNLAAESHVDRSIHAPAEFLKTNVFGTFSLLGAARAYWDALSGERKSSFRFHHISTDEVFGDLPFDRGVFTEDSPYAPSSPYSASKASADHLVRAWYETYGLPVLISNCSNNYGPYQFPEKLIPLVILNAHDERPLPVYGRGANVRDWLYVEDHARALELVLTKGSIGENYNIGGRSEQTNLQVVQQICMILDRKRPRSNARPHSDLIEFVADRPGHDRRYAIDPSKIERELGWRAQENFESGLEKTVDWYLENRNWWESIREGGYAGERLGLA